MEARSTLSGAHVAAPGFRAYFALEANRGHDRAVCVTDPGRGALEALRAVAVALLIAYHVCLLVPSGGGVAYRVLCRLGVMGWVGTDLLLALAGFLAVGSRARANSAPAWLGRRAKRVLPSFAAFLLLYLYLVPLVIARLGAPADALGSFAIARRSQAYLWSLSTNLLMVAGRWPGAALEPLLTLAIGAQLTLLAALVLSRPRPRVALTGLVLLECVGFALRAAWLGGDPWRSYCFPLTRCDAFASGMAAACLLSHPRWGDPLRRGRGLVLGAASALLFAAVTLTRGLPVASRATILVGYPAVGLFSGAVVLALSQAQRLGKWPRRAAVAGGAAYAVYLVKLPTIYAVRHLLRSWTAASGLSYLMLLLALGTLASALIGGLFYLAVERPLRRVVSRGLRAGASGSQAAGLRSCPAPAAVGDGDRA
jgi:peptidoglycan/LPS O-acetylase OafA/YrhL